jgi:hypothetical protein
MGRTSKLLLIFVLFLIILLSFSSIIIYYFFQLENERTEQKKYGTDKVKTIKQIMKNIDQSNGPTNESFTNLTDVDNGFIRSISDFFESSFAFVSSMGRFYVNKTEYFQKWFESSIHQFNNCMSDFEQSIHSFFRVLFDVYILPLIYIIAKPIDSVYGNI